MKILKDDYFKSYHALLNQRIDSALKYAQFAKKKTDFGYNTQASAVYSSNIEGNSIDLNSFMNYRLSAKKIKPVKEIEEIETLIKGYEYAQNEALSEKTFLQAHKILSKTLVDKKNQGKYRSDKVGVFGTSGLIYLAIEPELVKGTMHTFFKDIHDLFQKKLSVCESFYYASMIHLVFAHIHPFMDGNGRSARILEKWFLSQSIGPEFWNLASEKFYKEHQAEYYQNINLGLNYYALNYDLCMPFLSMLPKSIEN